MHYNTILLIEQRHHDLLKEAEAARLVTQSRTANRKSRRPRYALIVALSRLLQGRYRKLASGTRNTRTTGASPVGLQVKQS